MLPDSRGMNWGKLKPAAFANVDPHEFELLCRDLIAHERNDRHAEGAVLDGPAPENHPDGGVDLLFVVRRPPRVAAEEYRGRYGFALTPDAGRRAYSCKTGSTWWDRALREAGSDRGQRVLDVLREGGSFMLFTNRRDKKRAPAEKRDRGKRGVRSDARARSADPAPPGAPTEARAPHVDKLETVRRLAEAYAKTLRCDASVLDGRIHVLDANDLSDFLGQRQPVALLFKSYAKALGVEPMNGLTTVEGWGHDHKTDRRADLEFVPDDRRKRLLAQLVERLQATQGDPDERVVWLVGPPGVGKTRLVIEALRQGDLAQRVVVACSPEAGGACLREGVFRRLRDALLVIDDCQDIDLDRWMFEVRAQLRDAPDAQLLVITPRAPESLQVKPVRTWLELAPLDDDAALGVVRQKLGHDADPSLLERLARLSGGYPWFAALLAEEVLRGAEAPSDMEKATQLVLASRHDGSPSNEYAARVDARARALFLLVLTEAAGVDWNQLDPTQAEELCRAVHADSLAAVRKALFDCRARGLVRERSGGGFAYVTPAILAREIARWLLDPPPGKPPSIAGSLLRHLPSSWPRAIVERLTHLGLPTEALQSIAAAILAEIKDAGGLSALGPPAAVPAAALEFAAERAPREVARLLRERIEALPVDALQGAREIRRGLLYALGAARRVEGCFDDTEAALFRLALAENEAFADNATSLWGELFLTAVTVAPAPPETRLERLTRRCRSADAAERRVSLAGLGAALSQRGVLVGTSPRPVPREQAMEARRTAWLLLIELLLDHDARIASEAQSLLRDHLGDAVREGLLPRLVPALGSALPHLDEGGRRPLRDTLARLRLQQRGLLERSEPTRAALEQLSEAMRPQSFRERFRQQASRFGPPIDLAEERALDDALAQEGLRAPERPALGELDWLVSPEARRGVPLAIAFGRIDTERLLLAPLVERARAGAPPDILSGYCLGMSQAEGAAPVDGLLRAWAEDPSLMAPMALTIVRVGGDDSRVRLLCDVVCSRRLPDAVLPMLTWGRWSKDVGDEALRALVDALLARGSRPAAWVALELLTVRLEPGKPLGAFREPLLGAMERLAEGEIHGTAAYAWEIAGKRLLQEGAHEEVCRLAFRAVHPQRAHADEHCWALVAACDASAGASLWGAVRRGVEEDREDARRIAVDFRWRRVGAGFPADAVLRWVGDHVSRAILIATFAPVDAEELPPLSRGLVARFGPASAPARELATAVSSPFDVVQDMAAFLRKRGERAQRWARDPDPSVRAWASALARELAQEEATYAAYDEHLRARFGT